MGVCRFLASLYMQMNEPRDQFDIMMDRRKNACACYNPWLATATRTEQLMGLGKSVAESLHLTEARGSLGLKLEA